MFIQTCLSTSPIDTCAPRLNIRIRKHRCTHNFQALSKSSFSSQCHTQAAIKCIYMIPLLAIIELLSQINMLEPGGFVATKKLKQTFQILAGQWQGSVKCSKQISLTKYWDRISIFETSPLNGPMLLLAGELCYCLLSLIKGITITKLPQTTA